MHPQESHIKNALTKDLLYTYDVPYTYAYDLCYDNENGKMTTLLFHPFFQNRTTVMMSIMSAHSLMSISPQILKTTATQVNQFELPCPTFSSLIKNGAKYMPNEWTISRATDASSFFMAHVISESPASLPHCDRAIYLTLEDQNENGLNFDCKELYLADQILKKKTCTTTVEYLGDLLALLFSHSQAEDEEESEGELEAGEEEVAESSTISQATLVLGNGESGSEWTTKSRIQDGESGTERNGARSREEKKEETDGKRFDANWGNPKFGENRPKAGINGVNSTVPSVPRATAVVSDAIARSTFAKVRVNHADGKGDNAENSNERNL